MAYGTSGPSELTVELSLPLPGVALLVACGDSSGRVTAPRNVRLHRVASNRTLVHWRQSRDSCTRGYQVLFSTRTRGPFEPLGGREPLFPALFVDCSIMGESPACRGPGFLSVATRAVDGSRSALSRPVACSLGSVQ